MGCASSSRANIEENIHTYINDLILSKTSINEYKKNLIAAVDSGEIDNQKKFEADFLNPMFESSSGHFKNIKPTITEYLYKIKDENLTFFIVALAFLCDTLNFGSLKSNYEIILYDVLPNKLTRVIKQKNDLRVLRKFLKFYVRFVSQYILNAMEKIYNKTPEEMTAIADLKVIYGDFYVNELVKRMLDNATEKDFNSEKFFKANYEDLKHFKIRQKLFDIYNSGLALKYSDKQIQEMNKTDIFSDVPDDEDLNKEEEEENENLDQLRNDLAGNQLEQVIQAAPILVQTKKPEPRDQAELDNAATLINKTAKGKLFKKNFKTMHKPELEKQQSKINQYIINNFTHQNVKKADENRKQIYDIDGWKKFYPANTKTFNINHGEIHETKFLIFNGNEYYSGLLNRKGQKHGFGVSIQRQGDRYQGFFFENLYHGWGELIDKNGNLFQGEFLHGALTGKGERYTLEGSHYIGEFENFKKEGEGQEDTEFYYYHGKFHNNKKHGKGKIFMKVLKDTYEGEFLNDAVTGTGEYHWSNNNYYIGEFLNGKMHGKGINKWPDGTTYQGDYVNGIKEGHGRYERSNGKIYEGSFRDGKPHGKGKLITAKGTFDVEFKEGKLLSQGDVNLNQISNTINNLKSNFNKNKNDLNPASDKLDILENDFLHDPLADKLLPVQENIENAVQNHKNDSIDKLISVTQKPENVTNHDPTPGVTHKQEDLVHEPKELPITPKKVILHDAEDRLHNTQNLVNELKSEVISKVDHPVIHHENLPQTLKPDEVNHKLDHPADKIENLSISNKDHLDSKLNEIKDDINDKKKVPHQIE